MHPRSAQRKTENTPARTVHPKLILGLLKSLLRRIGYTTPPTELPEARTPRAVARRVEKWWEMEETAGRKMTPEAT